MTSVLFVCHGNICRSPMAEFVLKDLARRSGRERDFRILSAATSREEIGNDIHPGTRAVLRKNGVPFSQRSAVQMTQDDYGRFDLIVGMDGWNIKNILRIVGGDPEGKVRLLLDFTDRPGRDIADPWYTGDFAATYRDVTEGCRGILNSIK